MITSYFLLNTPSELSPFFKAEEESSFSLLESSDFILSLELSFEASKLVTSLNEIKLSEVELISAFRSAAVDGLQSKTTLSWRF